MTKKFKIIKVNQKQSTKFFEEKWDRIVCKEENNET